MSGARDTGTARKGPMTIVPGVIVGRGATEYLIALDPEDPATWGRTYDVRTGQLSALRPMEVWLKFMPYFVAGPLDLFSWEAEAILEAARRPATIQAPQSTFAAHLPDVDIIRESA